MKYDMTNFRTGIMPEVQGIPIVDDGYSRQPNIISGKQ